VDLDSIKSRWVDGPGSEYPADAYSRSGGAREPQGFVAYRVFNFKRDEIEAGSGLFVADTSTRMVQAGRTISPWQRVNSAIYIVFVR